MPEKFTDLLAYGLSLALAAGVVAFAAYKVVALDGMETPPANLGLNFPAPKRKVIMEGDPLTTQSLPARRERPAGRSGGNGLQAYELLTVVDGVAFVAVNGDQGKVLVPVTVGSRLPGGLTVSAIRQRNGRWWLAAGNLSLGQRPPPDQ